MVETFVALLLAHVLADFLFQSNWMVQNKARLSGLATHGAVVALTLISSTGGLHPALLWLCLIHLGIDLAKTRATQNLTAFLIDQAAHLVTLIALALWQPQIWLTGFWAAQHHAIPTLMAVTGFGLIAVQAGGFAIGLLMQPFARHSPKGLPSGGRIIGQLERGLIFAMVLLGQMQAIGLLIAAKSILRFGSVKDDRAASEYVIIGTLASIAWALAAAYGCHALLNFLPPLGIGDITP